MALMAVKTAVSQVAIPGIGDKFLGRWMQMRPLNAHNGLFLILLSFVDEFLVG